MISVIICSIDPTRFAAVKEMYSRALAGADWELIGIHDAHSLAEAYNRGVAKSRGEILIFSHDDVEILNPGFAERLQIHLGKYDIVGVAGTTRLIHVVWVWAAHPYIFGQIATPQANGTIRINIWGAPKPVMEDIQAIDGVFIAARRSVFERIQFDAATFDGFHLYDLDFSYAAYRAGLKLAVANDICLLHWSEGKFDEVWQRQARKFEQKWLSSMPLPPPLSYHAAVVDVADREAALEVMIPPYWEK